jgi:L-alanine-DL-glutamate epimerase-like enolase superfamily enzyme
MKVRRCESAYYRIPREVWWPVPQVGSTVSVDALELITCRVETADGIVGLGYAYTLGHGGAAVHTMLEAEVSPALTGRELQSPVSAWNDLLWRLTWAGRSGVSLMAIAAADIALWDAASKEAGLPLYRFLGAQREQIAVYGSGIDLAYTLDELLTEVRDFQDSGFTALKIKVGRSHSEDIQRVRAVRTEVGPDVTVMVDANMGWTLDEAARRARAFEEYEIAWLEEPLVPEDIDGHAELQRSTSIPIAAGETLFSPFEFKNYIQRRAIRILQVDVTRVGGITAWLEVASLAHAFHLPLAPHFVQDIHVHLLCAVPNAMVLEYLPWFDVFIEEPLLIEGGVARPPGRPGHGVTFKQDLLQPHRLK